MFNLYEIYTCNPETGERGWDIEFIIALDRDDAATFPNFDCVIMKEGSYCRKFQAELSRFPMTDAVKQLLGPRKRLHKQRSSRHDT